MYLGPSNDPIDKTLDDMLKRTLDGEIIPFDEMLDVLDEIEEEPEIDVSDGDIANAAAARAAFMDSMNELGLSIEDRFTMTRKLCALAESQPSAKLLRLLCYILCDNGVLLDLDREEWVPERCALSWMDIRKDAEYLYSLLYARRQAVSRFRELAGQGRKFVSLKQNCSRTAGAARQQAICAAVRRAFNAKSESPALSDNLLWLLQTADSDPALSALKPLFVFQVLTRHKKRLEESSEAIELDLRALWRRKEYRIDADNGKNFQTYVRLLSLFETLYELLGSDEGVDVPMCMAGFDCVSNLGDFYRQYPENRRTLPLCVSIDELFLQISFSCFEHGLNDSVMMTQGNISTRELKRFLDKSAANRRVAEEVAAYAERHGDVLTERFLATTDSQTAQLCKSILAEVLSERYHLLTAREERMFLAIVNNALMELVDAGAEENLKAAANCLCG